MDRVLGMKMDAWQKRNMQNNNIRTLLATLHTVVWEGCGWSPVSPSLLVDPE
jgi:hypothetical protein